jgi:hypothetical protein
MKLTTHLNLMLFVENVELYFHACHTPSQHPALGCANFLHEVPHLELLLLFWARKRAHSSVKASCFRVAFQTNTKV